MLRKNDFVLFYGVVFQIKDIDGSCLTICNDDFPYGLIVNAELVTLFPCAV